MYLIEKCAPQLLLSKAVVEGHQQQQEHEGHEGLGNYFEAVDEVDRNHIIKEEKYFRAKYVSHFNYYDAYLECEVHAGRNI